MKFDEKILASLCLFIMAFNAEAKNVQNAKLHVESQEVLDAELKEARLHKRNADAEGRRVVGLDLEDDTLLKRDAEGRRVVGLDLEDDSLLKRDAEGRRVVGLDLEDDTLLKRDAEGRRVVGLDLEDDTLLKRDAEGRRVVGLDLEDDSVLKRDAEGRRVVGLDLEDDSLLKRDDQKTAKFVVGLDLSGNAKRDANGEAVGLLAKRSTNQDYKYTLVPDSGSASIASALTQLDQLSIFSSYIRDLVDLYKVCEDGENDDNANINDKQNILNDEGKEMLLIFAPSNQAIAELSQKPWSFPTPVTEENNKQDETTAANIKNFVESHVVELSSIDAIGSKDQVVFSSINKNQIILKNDGESFKVGLPEVSELLGIKSIHILRNGAILIIDKALTWPERSE
ncbi:hypothetical protein BVG19_g1709 [[Candida] boidinii]|nr:hypothetical protein BVG19_g1709 [[Candida] boidinii]OWB52368.1 hypothetical protein B5S27_g3943 [[Candida] boidinii]